MGEAVTAKEFMQQAYWQSQAVDKLLEKYNRLWAKVTRTTPTLSGMPHGRASADRVCDCVSQMQDLYRQIDAAQDKLADAKEAIGEAISAVDDVQCRKLLHARYICMMRWSDIATKLELSENHVVNRLHTKALRKIQDIVVGY